MDGGTSAFATNGILRRLSRKTLALIEPHLSEVKLAQGTVLYQSGEAIRSVYFPLSGIVSMLAVLRSGEAIETGIVGRDGYVGGYFGPRGWRSPAQAVVQMAGEALRLDVRQFRKALDASEELRTLIGGYQAVMYFQAQQTAACQALHAVEARICRWLLHAEDAIGGGPLLLTQELLSQMMGVRRTSVSISANKLQADGLISYKRGVIRVLDRARLEHCACECYGAVRKATADILPPD